MNKLENKKEAVMEHTASLCSICHKESDKLWGDNYCTECSDKVVNEIWQDAVNQK